MKKRAAPHCFSVLRIAPTQNLRLLPQRTMPHLTNVMLMCLAALTIAMPAKMLAHDSTKAVNAEKVLDAKNDQAGGLDAKNKTVAADVSHAAPQSRYSQLARTPQLALVHAACAHGCLWLVLTVVSRIMLA